MAETRERALRAAVEEVGEHGIRALTHARVDARAGLPKGSTSNWFRTRASLLAGLTTYIAQAERADAPVADVATAEDLVAALCALVETATGPQAQRTRVRLALALESAHDEKLLRPLREERVAMVRWATGLMVRVGADDPETAARTVLACGNGLVFHRLTMEPEAEIRPVIERCVSAFV